MSETLEFRWIDPKERLPGVGQEVMVLAGWKAPHYAPYVGLAEIEAFEGDLKFRGPIMRWVSNTGLGSTTEGLNVLGWWPIPPIEDHK